MDSKVIQAARTAYEVNRAYLEGLEGLCLPTWGQLTNAEMDSYIAGVQFLCEHPETTPELQHLSWVAYKKSEGWVYGPVKDQEAKTHPNLVSVEALPKSEKAKDILFQTVVRGILGI